MAILTRAGMDKLLRKIMESGGLTDDMEEAIRRLRDDYDEREGILRKYGEVYDGEDKDDYEYTPYERKEDNERSGDYVSREEYEGLRKRYIDRFFGGRVDEIIDETREDVKRDGEKQTFDTLLERIEG